MSSAWYEVAIKEIGVAEVKGESANTRIVDYLKAVALPIGMQLTDETPWCSAFANWVMQQAGVKGTGFANARSWLKWGVGLIGARKGCIVVLKRGNPPNGHVGFYACDVGDEWIKVLGGNQGDQVKFSNFKKSDVIAYRWPVGIK